MVMAVPPQCTHPALTIMDDSCACECHKACNKAFADSQIYCIDLSVVADVRRCRCCRLHHNYLCNCGQQWTCGGRSWEDTCKYLTRSFFFVSLPSSPALKQKSGNRKTTRRRLLLLLRTAATQTPLARGSHFIFLLLLLAKQKKQRNLARKW